MSDIEFELKKQFAELRADDEANAPAYEAVRDRGRGDVEAARGLPSRRRWIAPAMLATAAAVLAAVWVASRPSSRHERAPLEEMLRDSNAVFRWNMPTDGLLTSARRALQTPALSGSVLDAAAVPIPGTPFKGD